MSLINKMLQDLDARGGAQPGAQAPDAVRAVPASAGAPSWLQAGGAVLALLVIGAAGWFGWRYWQQHAVRTQAHGAAPQVKSIAPMPGPVPPKPATAPAPVTAQSAAPIATPNAAPAAPAPSTANQVPAPSAPALRLSATLGDAGPAPGKRDMHAAQDEAVRKAAPSDSAPATAGEKPQPAEKSVNKSHKERTITASSSTAAQGSGLAPAQVAENDYRRALGDLQEGRVTEAMAGLEQALDLNPRHDAARQTLIGLLLENKRTDEAIHHLRLALGLDPAQPALAMVLARLQVESGGPAAETLLHTLPYAAANAEYHALLGAVLQRAARHAEAAAQYQAALKLAPQNGVWWMGLGISLQADKHTDEARDAYNRAKASGSLTSELQAYVERRLQQLAH